MKGAVPGIFYFSGADSISLTIEHQELIQLLKQKPSLVDLVISNAEPRECIIRDLQRDPVTNEVLHVDLLGIKRGQKLKVTVPVRLMGTAIGVKGGGILQFQTNELLIECLPKDIPREIEIDIEKLELGETYQIKELDFEELKFLDDPNLVIVSVIEPIISRDDIEAEEAAEAAKEEEGDEEEGEGSEDSESKN